MNWQTKSSQKNDTPSQGIWLTNIHLVRIFSCFILYSFLVFMVGYFWGKRAISYDLMQETEEIAHKDSAFLLQVYANQGKQEKFVAQDYTIAPSQSMETVTKDACANIPKLAEKSETTQAVLDPDTEKTMPHYYALLAGYPKENSAQKFADKLRRDGINVEIQKRSSKSSKGNAVAWYQVVTTHFTNREELVKLVEHVRRQECLKDDVRILTC